ncbi:MAG: histidine phosphatase family protein [Dermatophilaceae bacterium]
MSDAAGDGVGSVPSPVSARVLVLMRHAEACGSARGGDHSRQLTADGHEDARAVGEWLAEQGVSADLLLVSSAARARQTADELIRGGLRVSGVCSEDRIYNADADGIVACIREVPDVVTTLVLVGHAPGVPLVAAGCAGDETAEHRAGEASGLAVSGHRGGWPTAGVGVVAHGGSWTRFPDGSSVLVAHYAPGD